MLYYKCYNAATTEPNRSLRRTHLKRIVAVSACPTGVAHTMMAAEALKRAAELMGHQISVETQGAVGR